ncbi:hypothetical protein O181_011771 [Austropuccinia psidii MF-1]|uniref:Uncharacterized protein n=1 Tax=Austropuccinia psidii MF-1 TaxID=1389203 RepID=A0A9Q3BWD6_9BASI|nr:hypothetical protein [Austropuccinia psidii MF-1]
MPESQKLPNLSALKMEQNNQLVARADKQAKMLHQFSLIAERIQTCLTIDSGNFNAWSRSMTNTWADCFMGDTEYFSSNECDNDYQRNLIAMSFLQHSIERILFDPADHSNNHTNHAITVGEAIEAIENQIGAIDSNLITTLSLFFSAPQLHDQITNALDTRLAANPLLTIHSEDILEIFCQITSKCGKNNNDGSIHLSRINTQ